MIDANLQEEATSWFLSQRAGELSAADHEAFATWMARNPGAPIAYRNAERVWGIVGDLSDDAEIEAIRASALPTKRFGLRTIFWSAAATAACAVLAMTPLPGLLDHFLDVQLAPTRGGGQILSTEAGQRIATKLADGTLVTLDADTRLRVLEMGARRRIDLMAGHAFFRVAKDAAHPFLVTAMNKTVHAIGTAFDVRVEPDAVAVTLVEGKVRVDQPRGLLREPIATDMTPGKQLVAPNDQVWMMSPITMREATSWLGKRLTYTPGTVEKIVADMNAGSRRKIVFLEPIDQQQRLVGSFEPGDVDTLATVLEVKGIAYVVSRDEDRIEMSRATSSQLDGGANPG